jgi:hypothetical protein
LKNKLHINNNQLYYRAIDDDDDDDDGETLLVFVLQTMMNVGYSTEIRYFDFLFLFVYDEAFLESYQNNQFFIF